jgi:hypothetical protein
MSLAPLKEDLVRIRNLLGSAFILVLAVTSLGRAAVYDFLPVTSTGPSTSQFVSGNGNGVINVSHTFSSGGAGVDDNNNPAINPSQFTTLFPGTGLVQGHVAQTVYNHTSVVTFDLTGYALSTSTVFGIWNISDEVSPPVGGNPVYRVELIDSSNTAQMPSTFNLIGNQDNQTQVSGRHQLDLNTSTGELSWGALINAGGVHTDAAFWDNIPVGTKKIIVYGDLPALNLIGDGVGYYFAEVVPEPGSVALLGVAGIGLLRRRCRKL